MPFDIALRAAGVTALLLTAAVLLLSMPRSAVARWFVPFALGMAGFLAVNTPYEAAEPAAPLWAVASFLSRMAAVFLWLFSLVLFDGRVRMPRLALAVGGTWLVLVVVSKGYFAPPPAGIDLSAIQIALGAALVLHAGWRVMRELRDDLIESRRRARPLFALGLLGLLLADFAADLLQGYEWRPAAFLLVQNGVVTALAVGLALWLLRGDPWRPMPSTEAPAEAGAPGPADALIARLEAVMREQRPYLDPDLTIARFAALVGVPEPALRRAINHGLGHGHFRTYLNGYRVAEAQRRLRDPASAGKKILAIALESGFSSLASFNRVFRQQVGCAPSEYRASATPCPPAGAPSRGS